MGVVTLNKERKKTYDVYPIISIGDEWEIELEKETYTFSADSILERLNMQSSLIQSISNWFRAYDESRTDEYIESWGYGNHSRGTRYSTKTEKLIIKRVVLSS